MQRSESEKREYCAFAVAQFRFFTLGWTLNLAAGWLFANELQALQVLGCWQGLTFDFCFLELLQYKMLLPLHFDALTIDYYVSESYTVWCI